MGRPPVPFRSGLAPVDNGSGTMLQGPCQRPGVRVNHPFRLRVRTIGRILATVSPQGCGDGSRLVERQGT
jgi:hypothetical protein